VSDGRHAASIALLGNYMAGSFVTTADGHGGTLLTQAAQTAQPLRKTWELQMPRGSKPGTKRGGRKRGTPNRRTILANRIFVAAAALLIGVAPTGLG
jgi:hypothetical protein